MPVNKPTMLTISLPADVVAVLEDWRAANCPEVTIAIAARELLITSLNRGDAPATSAKLSDSVRHEVAVETRKWMHERVRQFLADLEVESRRLG